MTKQIKYPFLAETDFERIRKLAKLRVENKLKRKLALRGGRINV